jgi:hypothetical protein
MPIKRFGISARRATSPSRQAASIRDRAPDQSRHLALHDLQWRAECDAVSQLPAPVGEGRRKVFFIVDNLRVHRAKRVAAWLQANRHRTELFYLPPYAPEHNPDEFMHNDLKQTMARRRIPKDKAGLKSFLHSHMHRLQKMPAKVRAFFQAPEVR